MKYKAYLFDVQGTLLDFFEPVSAAVGRYLRSVGDDPRRAGDLTRLWRANYFARVGNLKQNVEDWTRVQDEYAAGFLDVCIPWPDTVAGLTRIRSHAYTATLSNTDMSTVIALFKDIGIDWDMVLTAEVFGAFKPDPVLYRRAVRFLGLQPADVAMVASHPYDLKAAAEVGLGTVFVHRPLEYGRADLAHDDVGAAFGQRVGSLLEIV